MEELAKMLAKANAEVERLTTRNAELEQKLASAVKTQQEEVSKMRVGLFEGMCDMQEKERKRSKFLGEIVNRPLKRAREIAAETEFDIEVVYEDGKYCKRSAGEDALNTREVCVSVVNGVIAGHDATDRRGEKVWAPAAVFPYRI